MLAFSEFGKDIPVSLKLLSGKTPIKGSYTNLADFLLVRGTPAIKYLIAYKQKTGKGVVEKLNILAFDITLENFVDFMKVVSGGSQLIKPDKKSGYYQVARELESHLKAFAANPSNEDLQVAAAMAMHGTQGYNRKLGQINKWIDDEDYGQEPSEDEKEKAEKEKAARSQQDFDKTKIDESVSEELLLEAGERQWAASLSQLKSIASIANLESYGVLDLSQQNIDDLVEIYTKKLGDEIMTLLETTKKFDRKHWHILFFRPARRSPTG